MMKVYASPVIRIFVFISHVAVSNTVIFTNESCHGRRQQRLENNQFRYKVCGPAGYFWIYDCEPDGTVFSSFYQKCLPVVEKIQNSKHRHDGYKIYGENGSTVKWRNTTVNPTEESNYLKISNIRLIKLYAIENATKQSIYKAPPIMESTADLRTTPTTVTWQKTVLTTTTTAKSVTKNHFRESSTLSSTTSLRPPSRSWSVYSKTTTTAAKSLSTGIKTAYQISSTTTAKSLTKKFPIEGSKWTPKIMPTTAKSTVVRQTARVNTTTTTSTTTAKYTTTKYKAKEPVVFAPRDLTAILDMIGDFDERLRKREHSNLEEPMAPMIYSSNKRLVAQAVSKNHQVEAERRFLERLRLLEKRISG